MRSALRAKVFILTTNSADTEFICTILRYKKILITNGECLEFIEDGGYENHMLWHSEGWDWVNENGINSPLYWNKHRRRMASVYVSRFAEIEFEKSRLPRFILRSVRLCRMERFASSDRI